MSERQLSSSRRSFLRAGTGVLASTGLSSVTLAYEGEDESTDASTVRIKRDSYGVAHVYASGGSERPAAYFGHGFAVAEDRLFQLEMYRRFYHGTVAAAIGPGEDDEWVQFDKEARRNRSTDTPLTEQLETQLDDEHRAVLDAFATGINRYIERVASGDRQFHKGFHDYGFQPDRWTSEDVAGVFVASMAYFSDYQLETLNAAVLDGLEAEYDDEEAMALLSDLNWGNDPGAPTSTEPPTEGYIPPYTEAGDTTIADDATSKPGGSNGSNAGKQTAHQHEHPAGERRVPSNPRAVHDAEMQRQRTLATGLDELGLPFKLGSNALAVAGTHTESGDALLFGGPQMGFTTPSVMYEIGLHGSDFDITGITVAGYPFVMFGHNPDGAMTSTAGLDNSIQTFVEEIRETDDGPQYRFRGDWYDVEVETQTVPVSGGDDAEVTVRRTRHGVVTQWNPEEGEAIAQSRSYEGRDMNSWKAFYEAQYASDAGEFVDAAQQCDYSLNFMWAGDDGDVAYVHLGRYPDWENVPWDTRFPADGTQYELTDDDYLRAADGEVPASINPSPGYTAQWNNKPAPGWNNGDMSYAWGTDHRVQRITNLVEKRLEAEGSVDYAFLKEIVYDVSFVDLRAIRYKTPLVEALEDVELTEQEQAAYEALVEWDDFRQGSGEDYLGEYPVGYTVFDAFFGHLLDETFEPTFGALGPLYGSVRGVFLNYRYGRPLLMRALHPEAAALTPAVDYFGESQCDTFLRAFRQAVSELSSEYGDDVSAWRAPARVDELDNMVLFGMPIGVGDAGDMPFLNRGTENHFVRVGATRGSGNGNESGNGSGESAADSLEMHAENILPPGNSGYVAPDGTKDAHYADQLDAFVDFEYKPLRFTTDEVARDTESTETVRRE